MLQGRGSSQPIVPNDNPEQRRKNRRVEILIYYRE
jgi:flagellar motor protein MotB